MVFKFKLRSTRNFLNIQECKIMRRVSMYVAMHDMIRIFKSEFQLYFSVSNFYTGVFCSHKS
ncbi:MAG: hypothetical protein RLZZ429_2045 [Bacteroidota bacterium]